MAKSIDKLVKKVLDKLEGMDDAHTYYVSSETGNDKNNGLTPDKPLKTLNRAVGKTHCGTVVLLDNSKILNEKVVSKKPIEINVGNQCLIANSLFENVHLRWKRKSQQ